MVFTFFLWIFDLKKKKKDIYLPGGVHMEADSPGVPSRFPRVGEDESNPRPDTIPWEGPATSFPFALSFLLK